MTRRQIEQLRAEARKRFVDMGGGGEEIYVNHNCMVVSRASVAWLCDLILALADEEDAR